MRHGHLFILGSKGQGSRSQGTKNSAGVGYCERWLFLVNNGAIR